MKLTFRYPVYPTKTQETTLFEWLDHLCDLQNSARHDRLVAHETEGAFVSLTDQQQLLTAAREKYDDFREVPQDFQNHALRRNDKAFANFRRRCKDGDAKKGYPRYKKRVRSLTWSLRKYSKVVAKKTENTDKQTIRVRQNPIRETSWKHDRLKVPELGEVKIYMHRPLQGDPKEVTLVKKASGWSAHITCELPDTPKVEPTDAIAVDMGTTHYLFSLRSIPKAKKRTTRAGIVRQKVYSENMLKTSLVRKKVATEVRNNNINSLYIMNEPRTDAKTLSANSSINFIIIRKTTSLLPKTYASLTWSRTNTSARASAMRLGEYSLSGVGT